MRTIFNNIIDNENLEPKLNTEYIYNLDMIWLMDSFESIPVGKGLIVENVDQMKAGNYSFNIKGQTEKYRCTYGWAFIENTPRNIELLKQIDIETEILNAQERKIAQLRNSLDRLYANKPSIPNTPVQVEKK